MKKLVSSVSLAIFVTLQNVTLFAASECELALSSDFIKNNSNRLFAVVVGGRASGNALVKTAQNLGFRVVHVFPDNLPQDVLDSFSHNTYEFDPIIYDGTTNNFKAAQTVAEKLRELAEKNGISIAGVTAAMDLGVEVSGYLGTILNLNSRNLNPQLIAIRSDKNALNELLDEKGVPVARSAELELTVDGTEKDLILPDWAINSSQGVFLKPTQGYASQSAGLVPNIALLREELTAATATAKAQKIPSLRFMVQEPLYPNKVYFVDSVGYVINGERHRIVTGVSIDSRSGIDFPPEIWDFVTLMPPRKRLDEEERQLFDALVNTHYRTVEAIGYDVGTIHLETMSRTSQIGSDIHLLPTDGNLRQPGLDYPTLVHKATGVNPYILEILAKTNPELLKNHPKIYSKWNAHLALLFVRSHVNGSITQEGYDAIQELMNPDQPESAKIIKMMIKPAETGVKRTTDGLSMIGVLHIEGPTAESLLTLREKIRHIEKYKLVAEMP